MKAISPVIATVIIVAVAIAISIAVALWLTGIVGGFTTVENLQITYAYANKTNGGSWTVELKVENKGTATATIDAVFVNGIPLSSGVTINDSSIPYTVPAGSFATVKITLSGSGYSSGQQVEIKLHTASGKEYPKMVTLP